MADYGIIPPATPFTVDDARPVFHVDRNDSDRDQKLNRPKPKVFYRRDNEAALSVFLVLETALQSLDDPRGYCLLLTSEIHSSPDPLKVIGDDKKDHANIFGVPLRSEDEEKALRIAKYLARIALDQRYKPTL